MEKLYFENFDFRKKYFFLDQISKIENLKKTQHFQNLKIFDFQNLEFLKFFIKIVFFRKSKFSK